MAYQQISESELILMRIIWAGGGVGYYAQIMEQLKAQGLHWKKNTVLTFLSRLVEKGMLRREKLGRRNEYTALVEEESYRNAQTRDFLDRIYEGNVSGLVSTLVRQDLLSGEDLETLRKFWDAGKETP